MSQVTTLKRWAKDQAEEDAMTDDHAYMWRRMIDCMYEHDLTSRKVLDFGCNQGGFLRTLGAARPYKYGLGFDLAADSVAKANDCRGMLPVDYVADKNLVDQEGDFDVAFSHEVMYLIPDLKEHAADMKRWLKPGGVYYAAIGCHTDNPLWPEWRKLAESLSNIDVQDYALDDYAEAFFAEGFKVTARKFLLDDFILIKRNNPSFPKMMDSLNYHCDHKIIFRFERHA